MKPCPVLLRTGLVAALLAAAMTVAPVDVRAEVGGRLRGAVMNGSGQPLAGAQVRLSDRAGAVVATVAADGAGRYAVDVPPGTYDVAVDHGSGATAANAKVADVAVGVDTPLDIAIVGHSVRPSILSGRLVDTAGQPLPFVDVGFDDVRTVTDEDGRFTLAARPGRDDLSLGFHRDGLGLIVNIDNFDLTVDRTVNWTIPLATVDVLVRDSSGKPRSWFLVELDAPGTCFRCAADEVFPGGPPGRWSRAAWTPDSGRVRFLTLATKASLTVSANGWETQTTAVSIKEPSSSFEVGVKPAVKQPAATAQAAGSAMDGVLTSAAAPEPEEPPGAEVRVEVRLRNPDGTPRDIEHVTLISPEGRWVATLAHTGPGLYAASVAAGSYSIGLDGSPDREGESEDIDDWGITSAAVDLRQDTAFDLVLPEVRHALVRFVDSQGRSYDAAADADAQSATGSLTLAPGLTATPSAFISYVGEVSSFVVPLFAPALFETKVLHPYKVDLSSLPVSPGGELVIAFPAGVISTPAGKVNCLQGAATGPSSVALSWSPPVDDGGAPVIGYDVESSNVNPNQRRFLPAGTTSIELSGYALAARIMVITVKAVTVNGLGDTTLLSIEPPAGSDAKPCVPVTAAPGGGGPGGSDAPGGGQPDGQHPGAGDPPAHSSNDPASGRSGYWALAQDGHVYPFGDARALGNGADNAVDLEPTPTGEGYWVLQANGRVSAFGDASAFGNVDTATLAKGEVPASLSATPSGRGYWVFTNRGRAVAFGDAPFLGDMSETKLNGPVLDSVATPSGRGYYMVASDGGIFAFGDAAFAGSMGGKKLNAPVQSLVPDGDGKGYWLVASDGGIFAFDAPFRGSMGGTKLNKPISGMVRYGDGYLMVGADGGVFNFSSRPFAGSLGSRPPASPVVAVAAMP